MSAFRVPYLVGTQKVRDHGYMPIVPASYFDSFFDPAVLDNSYPVSIALSRYLKWLWRIKTWKLSGSISFAGTITDPTPDYAWSGSATFPEVEFSMLSAGALDAPPNTVLSNVADEKHLIGPAYDVTTDNAFVTFTGSSVKSSILELRNFGLWFVERALEAVPNTTPMEDTGHLAVEAIIHSAEPNNFVSGPTTISGAVNLMIAVLNNASFDGYPIPTVYDPVTNLFRPTFYVAGGFGGSYQIAGDGPTRHLSAGFYTYADPAGVTDSSQFTGSLTIDDGEGPLSVALHGNGVVAKSDGGGTGSFSSGSCEAALTAVKWWPYKTKSGLPVYDEDTGAQINDPFS